MVIASQWLLFGEICPLVFDGLFRWILSSKEWISVLGLGLVVEWVDVLCSWRESIYQGTRHTQYDHCDIPSLI